MAIASMKPEVPTNSTPSSSCVEIDAARHKSRNASHVYRWYFATGYAALILTCLFACLWVASTYWAFSLSWGAQPTPTRQRACWQLTDGVIQFFYTVPGKRDRSPAISWDIDSAIGNSWLLWPTYKTRDGAFAVLAVPLWIPLASAVLAGLLLFRRGGTLKQRTQFGQCATCGYDRTGLAATAPCPECGACKSVETDRPHH